MPKPLKNGPVNPERYWRLDFHKTETTLLSGFQKTIIRLLKVVFGDDDGDVVVFVAALVFICKLLLLILLVLAVAVIAVVGLIAIVPLAVVVPKVFVLSVNVIVALRQTKL